MILGLGVACAWHAINNFYLGWSRIAALQMSILNFSTVNRLAMTPKTSAILDALILKKKCSTLKEAWEAYLSRDLMWVGAFVSTLSVEIIAPC